VNQLLYFSDRRDAGRQLAHLLRSYKDPPGLVLAVPRGGVPVAYEVAVALGWQMDLILTKKIGHPMNKEYAIGAASLADHFIVPHADVGDSYIIRELDKVRQQLLNMKQRFMGDREPVPYRGKTLIVVDDGIATGNTLLATIRVLRKSRPARIVIAAPVASEQAVAKLRTEADEVVAVLIPEFFQGVGAFYRDFPQLQDEEVDTCLKEWRSHWIGNDPPDDR
jgi:predicted phosphoribosyltransferase